MSAQLSSDQQQLQQNMSETENLSCSASGDHLHIDDDMVNSILVEDGSEDEYIRGADVYAPLALRRRTERHNPSAASLRRKTAAVSGDASSPSSFCHTESNKLMRFPPHWSDNDQQLPEVVARAPTPALLWSPKNTSQGKCLRSTSEKIVRSDARFSDEKEVHVEDPGVKQATDLVAGNNIQGKTPVISSRADDKSCMVILHSISTDLKKVKMQHAAISDAIHRMQRQINLGDPQEQGSETKIQELNHLTTSKEEEAHQTELLASINELISSRDQVASTSEHEIKQLKAQLLEANRQKDRFQIMFKLLSRALTAKEEEHEAYKVRSRASRHLMVQRMIAMEHERRDQVRALQDELDRVKGELLAERKAQIVAGDKEDLEIGNGGSSIQKDTSSSSWSVACDDGQEQEATGTEAASDFDEDLSDLIDVGAELADDKSSIMSVDALGNSEFVQ